jgi:hypothetical protein
VVRLILKSLGVESGEAEAIAFQALEALPSGEI